MQILSKKEKIVIKKYGDNVDCQTMLKCLTSLGLIKEYKYDEDEEQLEIINNHLSDRISLNSCEINVNNSGTTIRFILGLLYLNSKQSVINVKCDQYMKNRPIKELIDAYQTINSDVHVIYEEKQDYLPVTIITNNGWTRKQQSY